jgi:hypothetical protein
MEGLIKVGFQGVCSRVGPSRQEGEGEVGLATGGRSLMATSAVASLWLEGQERGLTALLSSLQASKGWLNISSHYDTTPIQVSFGALVEDLQPNARYLVMKADTGVQNSQLSLHLHPQNVHTPYHA